MKGMVSCMEPKEPLVGSKNHSSVGTPGLFDRLATFVSAKLGCSVGFVPFFEPLPAVKTWDSADVHALAAIAANPENPRHQASGKPAMIGAGWKGLV